MDINQIVARARAVLAEENISAGVASSFNQQHRTPLASVSVMCRACNQPNHHSRACLARHGWRRGGRGNMRCYGCGQPCPHPCFVMSGKRNGRGSTSASLLSGLSVNGALPGTRLLVNGVNCDALIDTGCTKCIVHAPLCSQWTRESANVTTVSGERYQCMGNKPGTGTVTCRRVSDSERTCGSL